MAGRGRVGSDLSGQTFGLLYVLKRCEKTSNGKSHHLCLCKCGREKIIQSQGLLQGTSTSCGQRCKMNIVERGVAGNPLPWRMLVNYMADNIPNATVGDAMNAFLGNKEWRKVFD